MGIGALLFATGNGTLASVGRLLQGAGGVFALVGAAYIATTNFPASRAATLIGATQMFGMAGGSAGQFLVGPLIGRGMAWQTFWIGMGVLGLAISVVLYLLLPPQPPVALLPRVARVGHLLPLPPDPHDADVLQLDPALAIEAVEALHHVIWLAGAGYQTGTGDDTGTVPPRNQRGHGPEPCILDGAEGLRPEAATRSGGLVGAGGGGHQGGFPLTPKQNVL